MRGEEAANESYQMKFTTEVTYIRRISNSYIQMKRVFDVLVSVLILLFSLPFLIIAIIAIKLESPGSAFYWQERLGLNGRKFRVVKLRSMYVDAEKNGAQWATKNDPRVTKVGGFLRKTRIDELPQLINVLIGEMSMVGPRPEREVFTDKFNKEIPGFINRLLVKPGLTGLAQVNGGYDNSPKEKLDFDLIYIREMSFLLDIKIMLQTIKVVFTGEGAR